MNTDNTDQATAIDKIVKGEKPKSLKHGGEEEPEEMSWMADNYNCVLCVFCALL
jgi:succinate dehydrogenase/fumarate reductase-like Fe-S protein